jgi:ABC-type nitrate/sulfonate/bicarbonate transport system substrate-binding protein
LLKLLRWLLALSICTASPLPLQGAETARIRASYASLSPSSSILSLTQDAGFFKREGLDVEVLYVPAGSLNVQALISKELQLSTLGGPAVVQAGLQGADLVYFAGIANRLMVALVAQPSIKRVAELRKKRIGITRFGSNIDLQARVLLSNMGVAPKETTFLQIGGNVERLAALKSGLVDASFFSPEMMSRAKQEGLSILFDPRQNAPIPWLQTGVVTSRDLIINQRALVRSLARAVFNGMGTFRNDPEFTLRFLARFLRQNDRDQLREAYEEYSTDFPWPPYPTKEGLSFILEQSVKSSSKKADDFIDLSFLNEFEKQGFFRK